MDESEFNNVATFIVKLWKMLNKTEAADIMFWNSSGKSFIIQNQVQFITKLLPMYFKHNNMGSFIRQLNLYDFHKICIDKTTELEYQHKYFQRYRPDLLKYIKRKLPQYKRVIYSKVDREELTNLTKEIITIQNKQDEMNKQLYLLQQENLALLKEFTSLYAKQNAQNQVLKKIIEIMIPFMESYNFTKTTENNATENNAKILQIDPNLTKIIDFEKNSLNQDIIDINSSGEAMSSVLDLKDLLPNLNQSRIALNEDINFEQNIDKGPKSTLSDPDDFTSLLESDIINCYLMGQSNELAQESTPDDTVV